MSAVLSPRRPLPPPVVPARFTCEEFHDMGDSGALEGRSVILVDGEILDMPNPNPPHDSVVGIADYVLKSVFAPPNYWVRVQTGFPTKTDTDPVPDLSVVAGSPRDYPKKHPKNALLVVEVADSSLAFDLSVKAELYAEAGIADYWVIDVVNERLHVFRDPRRTSSSSRTHAYRSHVSLGPSDVVSPLALPAVTIPVSDLLP